MFRFLAKSAVATVIWKRYNRVIVATLTLLISYVLIAALHGDYIDYARSTGVTNFLWLSYFAKWGAYLLITSVYYWFLKRALRPKRRDREAPIEQARTRTQKNKPRTEDSPTTSTDPFADIRRKDTLKSRADFAMQNHRTKRHD